MISLSSGATPFTATALASERTAVPIVERHRGAAREDATKVPRGEGDQALVDGWPLYRTERGQGAFNDAMAALAATEVAAPSPAAFIGCPRLACNLKLPAMQPGGWLPAGRIWVSPSEYVLIVRSPRLAEDGIYRRHAPRAMSYFVFHEFHNSTRNTDPYDTISSHSSHVFVPFYMGKQGRDVHGRRFVVVVQVAPWDVVSTHATNMGSAGPGIEVAKNATENMEPLQGLAGILVASLVTAAAPRLDVVNHRGSEGLEMLEAYQLRLARIAGRKSEPRVVLPFVPARPMRVAAASVRLEQLIVRRGLSRPVAVADRGIVPRRQAAARVSVTAGDARPARAQPMLIGPIRLATRPAAPPPVSQPEPRLVAPTRPAMRPTARTIYRSFGEDRG